MARRHRADKRVVIEDPRYDSKLVALFVNAIMRRGKKSVAQGIVYGALDHIHQETKSDPVEFFEDALENIKPKLEVKSRRVGGATYQVPIEVTPSRQISLALRWIIQYGKARRGVPVSKAIAMELMDAHKGQGSTIKKRDDTHKMAQANKAFAHYRW